MERAIEIGIHSKAWTLRGLLRRVRGSRMGAIIIGDHGPSYRGEVHNELGLYLQSAGCTTMQVDYVNPDSLADCIYDTVGMLSALHAWGVERVVLIIWPPSAPEAPFEPYADAPHGSTTVGRVVEAIVGMAGVVTGVVSIRRMPGGRGDMRQGSASHLRLLPGPTGAPPRAQAPASFDIRADAPGRLSITLDPDSEHPAVASALVSRIYTWTLSMLKRPTSEAGGRAPLLYEREAPLLFPEPLADLDNDAMHSMPSGLKQFFTDLEYQFDRQWQDMLDTFELRDPARATNVRELAKSTDEKSLGNAVRRARSAWPLLDFEACSDWLYACSDYYSQIRELATSENGGMATRGATSRAT